MILLSVLVIAACKHGPSAADCEKTRDHFLANYNERITKLLAEDDEAHKAKDAKDAEVELANAKAKFVDVCKATSDFKPECFASVATEDSADCKKFVRDITHQVVR